MKLMTISENIFLGNEITGKERNHQLGPDLPAHRAVSERSWTKPESQYQDNQICGIGEQQLVEIAKAISKESTNIYYLMSRQQRLPNQNLKSYY